MSPDPDERDRIRAAMDRILAGAPEQSNGALTVVALAIEADVPRNALTQRHTDLKDEFYQRIKERGADNGDEARLRATIASSGRRSPPRTKNSPSSAPSPCPRPRREPTDPKNQQLRDMRGADGNVIPFPGRRPVRPHD